MVYVEFPDPEDFVVARLNLAGFRASTEIEDRQPNSAPFVRVMLLGGGQLSLVVEEALIRFEAWALDVDDASTLARKLRATVGSWAYEPGNPLRVEEESRPAPFPDDRSDWHRYSFDAVLTMRGSTPKEQQDEQA